MTLEPPSIPLKGAPAVDYLPVVDLTDGRLLGLQARLRWVHPEHGVVPHERLVPWAEQNGTIVALGRWMLAQACEDAACWSPSVQLAVQCSLAQLRQGEASKAVAVALEMSGLAAHRLTLEVAEPVVADGDASGDLGELTGMGVELAVTDVGASWSSFEPFQRRSVATVCVGASFVVGLEAADGMDRLVVETVVRMAHALGMAVIAEGLARPRHLALLRALGVDAGFGPFFAPLLTGAAARVLATSETVPHFSLDAPCRLTDGRPVPLPVPVDESDAAPVDEVTDATPPDATPEADEREEADGGDEADEAGHEPATRSGTAKGSTRSAASRAAGAKKAAPSRRAGGPRQSEDDPTPS